jgi:universal stress protein E
VSAKAVTDAIERILVGLDLGVHRKELTRGSRLAARQALALARAEGAEVLLFHSLAADEYWVESPEEGYVFVDEGHKPEGQQALEGTLAEFRNHGVAVELVTSAERADRGIIRQVRERDVDLVVTGKRTESASDGRPIGSVSMKLLRRCPCAVFVVKAGSEAPPRSVLVATDLSGVGKRATHWGARLARDWKAELHVVHAFPLPLSVQMEGGAQAQSWESERRDEIRREIEQELRQAEAPESAAVHVGVDSPTSAILACVRRFDPGLVVLGTVSRGGLPGLLEGNTAERLLPRLDCSLLAVKPEDFVAPDGE